MGTLGPYITGKMVTLGDYIPKNVGMESLGEIGNPFYDWLFSQEYEYRP